MFTPINLRSRIVLLLCALILTNLCGAGITLWYSHQTRQLYITIVDQSVAALTAAQELEAALVMQKGYVTYFFLTNEQQWLTRLEDYHEAFQSWLEKARQYAHAPEEIAVVNDIESKYIHYTFGREQVIALYETGQEKEGTSRHWEVREEFHRIYELCETFKSFQEQRITRAQQQYTADAHKVTLLAWIAIPFGIGAGFLLAYILLVEILKPIRHLALDSSPGALVKATSHEIRAIKQRVHDLLADVDHTHTELERSREHLVQSEKMVLVGKLAAGTAHSIRNPLTSVKMRLFSLGRSLRLNETQKEDFEVIAEEIRHIDTIVQNFLEFSRPPKLQMQPISPSVIVDQAVKLLEHRIRSYDVTIRLSRKAVLPEIQADPEQLKEVLANLIVNACEAMGKGGFIDILEDLDIEPRGKRAVCIHIADTGPGIPEAILEKIFDPFFTTKEEGTGLGLSIAARIIQEHGGRLRAQSPQGRGAEFTILLPV